ncbi:MAG: S-layer protein domain-containing protein [Candidatus Methanoperedens sp.]|nr:S-layer protein domain-containing protein [Candidatus Methanoperedens sp.]
MEAAHQRTSHSDVYHSNPPVLDPYKGCYICHPGYSVNKTGSYGSTNDVHKNRTCDFCHGNWTYIRTNLTLGGGAGVPKIPSCYECHPINNSNIVSISTLANLTPGTNPNVTGVNISVYSYNYDTGTPLTAHNGTSYSLISSVPCIVCHGPAHNISKPDPALTNTNSITESSQCISCHGSRHGSATNCTGCHTQDAHSITKPAGVDNCNLCHSTYATAVNNSMHNRTRNVGAPNCTLCHTDYDNITLGHNAYVVTESNTCRDSGCHVQNISGFYERHTSTSDCTACHFANTTGTFNQNTSLYAHDHNLTIEHNFYEYNISGIPLTSNLGTGKGMFPYYSCTLACHKNYGEPLKIDEAAESWLESAHARSRHGNETYDSKNLCAKCKSPFNYNASASSSTAISESDWQGIQCRVCHNLHDRRFPNNTGPSGLPIAFYNATASSYVNYSVYDRITNNTDLCEKCHQTGGSNDRKFAGIHKTNLSFTCTSCHMNSSFSRGMHDFLVQNTTSGVTGCKVCHPEADHTWSFTSTHENKVKCEACHDKTVSRNATGYAVSSDNNYGIYKDPTTNNWTTYKLSHGTPATWPLHNISKSVSCDRCHNATTPYNGTTRQNTLIAGSLPLIRNCISCHDTGGSAPYTVDFTLSNSSDSVHRTLNVNNSNSVTRNNSKCWGCHGDGNLSESAQPENDHPANYDTPKNCNNNDCHSISQSSNKETMIYSHFKNASLNGNPNNITNYNITTSEQCENCHSNSIVTDDRNSKLALVSHYASTENLIDSFNCVYCHLNKDNSEDWGNATLINKDRAGTIEVNREDNNITLFKGQTVDLGEGYSLKLLDISALRGDALIQILNKGAIIDQAMVHKDDPYTYERKITIDNATFKTPAVTISINSIFTGTKDSFIQFEATRPRKIHTAKESKDSACFACHMFRYSNEKERYKVIDREEKDDDDDDIIYYTQVLLDQKLENKSKIYFNDENFVFEQLGIMDKFISAPRYQKYLEDGQTWQISDKYSLRFKASSTDRLAWLEFMIDNKTVEDNVVSTGSVFTYEPDLNYNSNSDNMTIFTTNVTSVFLGKKDFIILEDSELLSTQILKIYANTTQFGYNVSWLYPGNRFTLGKIPSNLHVPSLLDENNNWADCVGCHDTSNNLRITQINAISTRLGKHSILNAGVSNTTIVSDTIDKACWACHTEGAEPLSHPSTYIVPRKCASCHKDKEMPYYGARYIGDEHYGNGSNCEGCHVSESHNIRGMGAVPAVDETTTTVSRTNISTDTGVLPDTQKITPGLSVVYFVVMFLVAYLVIYGFGKKL